MDFSGNHYTSDRSVSECHFVKDILPVLHATIFGPSKTVNYVGTLTKKVSGRRQAGTSCVLRNHNP